MEQCQLRFRKNNQEAVITYQESRRVAALELQRWFLGEIEKRELTLRAKTTDDREVYRLGDDHVLKFSSQGRVEYQNTLRAETLTKEGHQVLTPRVGALLEVPDTGFQAFTMEKIDGAPIMLLDSERLSRIDKLMIRNAVMYALGVIHAGDGKTGLIHLDAHMGNFMHIPNPDISKARTWNDLQMAEVRIIDLQLSEFLPLQPKDAAEALDLERKIAYDIMIALHRLVSNRLMEMDHGLDALHRYLEGNPIFSVSELRKMVTDLISVSWEEILLCHMRF